jgi:hypothetical protein
MTGRIGYLDCSLHLTPDEARDILQALRCSNGAAAALNRDGVVRTLRTPTRLQVEGTAAAVSRALDIVDRAARRSLSESVAARDNATEAAAS